MYRFSGLYLGAHKSAINLTTRTNHICEQPFGNDKISISHCTIRLDLSSVSLVTNQKYVSYLTIWPSSAINKMCEYLQMIYWLIIADL